MTGPEADRLGVRIALHLRKNRFEQCHNILQEAEAQFVVKNRNKKHKTPLAELELDLRVVNALAKYGNYIYVEDLQWLDISELSIIPNFGTVGKTALKHALDKHYRAKRLKEKEQWKEANEAYATMVEGDK